MWVVQCLAYLQYIMQILFLKLIKSTINPVVYTTICLMFSAFSKTNFLRPERQCGTFHKLTNLQYTQKQQQWQNLLHSDHKLYTYLTTNNLGKFGA